jgi:HSP20 family molecular chaperone IbpA
MFTYKSTFEDLYKEANAAHKLTVLKDDKFHVYSLEVPYFEKEDITVKFKNNRIYIYGDKEVYGTQFSLETNFLVNETYTEEDISVEYKAGVLFFKFPKELKLKIEKKLKIS